MCAHRRGREPHRTPRARPAPRPNPSRQAGSQAGRPQRTRASPRVLSAWAHTPPLGLNSRASPLSRRRARRPSRATSPRTRCAWSTRCSHSSTASSATRTPSSSPPPTSPCTTPASNPQTSHTAAHAPALSPPTPARRSPRRSRVRASRRAGRHRRRLRRPRGHQAVHRPARPRRKARHHHRHRHRHATATPPPPRHRHRHATATPPPPPRHRHATATGVLALCRYDILTSCLLELRRAGVVAPFEELLPHASLLPLLPHPPPSFELLQGLSVAPTGSQVAASTAAVASTTATAHRPPPAARRPPPTAHRPPPTGQAPRHSMMLHALAARCEGLSGRALRKLPFLAHANLIASSATVSLEAYLDALHRSTVRAVQTGRGAPRPVLRARLAAWAPSHRLGLAAHSPTFAVPTPHPGPDHAGTAPSSSRATCARS